MTITNDDVHIRRLVATRVRQSPEPLTAAQIARRAPHDMFVAGVPGRRPRSVSAPVLASVAAAVTALLVAGGLFMLAQRDTGAEQSQATGSVSGVKVGAYFLPVDLPEDFRMLAVHERAGDPLRIDPARAVYEAAGGGKIELDAHDVGEDQPAWPHSAAIPGGVARWSVAHDSPVGEWVDFEIVFDDGRTVTGESRGVTEAAIEGVLASVRPGAGTEPPTLAHPDFSLVAAGAAGSTGVIAEWTAYWGPPGGYLGAGSLKVTVRRFRSDVVELRRGVWDDTVELVDRTVYRGTLGVVPAWYPAPDVEVEVYGAGTIDAHDAIAALQPVDEASFAAAVSQIESTVELVPEIGATVQFPSGVSAEYAGAADDARGVCLTAGDARACDLAVTDRAGFTEDNRMVFFDTELLIDGRWFATGLRIDRGAEHSSPTVPQGAETVQVGDRTYYLVERPADALMVTGPYGDVSMRPAR